MPDRQFICDNLGVNADGHLTFAGQDTVLLAKEYGTPLYLMDEDRIRYNCRLYVSAFQKYFPEGSLPLYASKANAFKRIYRIMEEEGLGVDVVSAGEIYTAEKAGFPLARAYFHSNNKTDSDISYAMDAGVGFFVADSAAEIDRIQALAAGRNFRQKVLLRLTPGIDPHTFAAVDTGKVDSKFGTAIETGQADELVRHTLAQENIELCGFHCHVGSQVFGEDVFNRAAVVMLSYIAHIRALLGYTAQVLDLGGGYGVRYTASDPVADIEASLRDVALVVNSVCSELSIPVPVILMEPGRSIVADAGLTLYTAGTVKRIPGYKNYISVDGGMTDNPRFALYEASYTCYNAGRMLLPCDFLCDIVGRCCESGDIIQPAVRMPGSSEAGDIIAVCTTGAYNYAMASNYNRLPRPPIVMLSGGASYLAVRRETLDDLVALDL